MGCTQTVRLLQDSPGIFAGFYSILVEFIIVVLEIPALAAGKAEGHR